MIVLRQLSFSSIKIMVDKLNEKLTKDGIEDFEVLDRLPNDTISIAPDNMETKIYIPKNNEYIIEDLEYVIKHTAKFVRIKTVLDRGFYIINISGQVTVQELEKITKFIIGEEGFITLLENKLT